MTATQQRKTAWTRKRLKAAINACTSMLASEEGAGDNHCAHVDLEAALKRLQEELEEREAT